MCLTTSVSSAVRVCTAAKEMGLDLRGVAFIAIGEPYTEARRKIVGPSAARFGVQLTDAGTSGKLNSWLRL